MSEAGSFRGAVRSAAMAGLIAVVAGSASCKLGDDAVPFVITVDSLTAVPGFLEDGLSLRVRFFGTMGPDKCWMFERTEQSRTLDEFQIRFHGRHVIRDRCPQSPSLLDYEVQIPPPHNDPFTVTAHQPDGSKLQRVFTR